MSIEKDLTRIATALEAIAVALSKQAKEDVKHTPNPVQQVVGEQKQSKPVETVTTSQPAVAPSVPVAPSIPGSFASILDAQPAVVAQPAPVVVSTPIQQPMVTTPAAPVFIQQPAPNADLPFRDQKGLVNYVMQKYQQLGPADGLKIQDILGALGYKNINEVKPEHYGTLYQQVEAIV